MTPHAELVVSALRHFVEEHGTPNLVTGRELAACHSSLTATQINRVGRRERKLWVVVNDDWDVWATYERGAWSVQDRKET